MVSIMQTNESSFFESSLTRKLYKTVLLNAFVMHTIHSPFHCSVYQSIFGIFGFKTHSQYKYMHRHRHHHRTDIAIRYDTIRYATQCIVQSMDTRSVVLSRTAPRTAPHTKYLFGLLETLVLLSKMFYGSG